MLVVLAAVATIAVWRSTSKAAHIASSQPCAVTISSATYRLDSDQAANATTVAAVGKRLGLADHAVTIALAAALQESGLRNLGHGDRDSLGLFQQRPSQGWGTPEAILTPRLAAARFYERLATVAGWQTLSVSAAAQRVQRSAAPSAYADWEAEARALAQAMTGESGGGLACQYASAPSGLRRTIVDNTLAAELGSPGSGALVTAARGWTIASWLVAHARSLQISTVTFAGRTWTRSSGAWQATPQTDFRVAYA